MDSIQRICRQVYRNRTRVYALRKRTSRFLASLGATLYPSDEMEETQQDAFEAKVIRRDNHMVEVSFSGIVEHIRNTVINNREGVNHNIVVPAEDDNNSGLEFMNSNGDVHIPPELWARLRRLRGEEDEPLPERGIMFGSNSNGDSNIAPIAMTQPIPIVIPPLIPTSIPAPIPIPTPISASTPTPVPPPPTQPQAEPPPPPPPPNHPRPFHISHVAHLAPSYIAAQRGSPHRASPNRISKGSSSSSNSSTRHQPLFAPNQRPRDQGRVPAAALDRKAAFRRRVRAAGYLAGEPWLGAKDGQDESRVGVRFVARPLGRGRRGFELG